ncbi:ferredoxin [Fulvivirga sp. M361]|uniref:ferredoxin n=1 Tax=Fulvivirga sp. M361 TaxID=2594266 RepID=UPI00117A9D4C|nr:ferredoxin [Fulvivirga sp. M361]TRX58846.1 ferredoxin [Fulvivirga sp. M361]
MVRIVFYRGKCIGCNGCVEAAPNRWRVSKKDGRCNLIEGKEKKGIYQVLVNDDEYAENVQAATNCPVKIIQVSFV